MKFVDAFTYLKTLQPHKQARVVIINSVGFQEKTDAGWFQFKCVLTVQGFIFESTCTSKKGARNQVRQQNILQLQTWERLL